MAETITATHGRRHLALTWRATLRMRSMSATEVPPNFMTRRAMLADLWAAVRRQFWREGVRLYRSPGRKGGYTYRFDLCPATGVQLEVH